MGADNGQSGFLSAVIHRHYNPTSPPPIITRGLSTEAHTMQCPKCKIEHERQTTPYLKCGLVTTECLKCGIVFAKYYRLLERTKSISARVEVDKQDQCYTADEAKQELRYRVFALPVALLVARVLVGTFPGFVRLLTMWVHEAGH